MFIKLSFIFCTSYQKTINRLFVVCFPAPLKSSTEKCICTFCTTQAIGLLNMYNQKCVNVVKLRIKCVAMICSNKWLNVMLVDGKRNYLCNILFCHVVPAWKLAHAHPTHTPLHICIIYHTYIIYVCVKILGVFNLKNK